MINKHVPCYLALYYYILTSCDESKTAAESSQSFTVVDMRFSAGLGDSDYSDESDLDSSSDSDSDSLLSTTSSSASSDSFCYASDSQVPISPPFVLLIFCYVK